MNIATGYLGPRWGAAVVALVAVMPALTVVPGGSSGLFYVLCAGALLLLAMPSVRQRLAADGEARLWRTLAWAGVLYLVAMVAVQAAHGQTELSLERPVRFLLLLPLVLLFRLVEPRQLRHVQWGIVATAVLLAAMLVFPPAVLGSRPDTVQFSRYNTVGFANLTLLFAVLSLFCCGWVLTRHRRLETCLKLAAGLFALYGFVLSETRTGLLAAPVFLLIGFVMMLRCSWRARVLALAAAAAFCVAVLSSGEGLWQRIGEGAEQYAQCRDEPLTRSSVCIRMQLAGAAIDLFRSRPLFGVGDGDQFRQALKEQSREGQVSAFVAAQFGETHNDTLYFLAAYGAVGATGAVLFVYALPAWLFLRFMRTARREARLAAAMGLAVCLGFLAFGLTEMMFRGMRTISLYSTLLAVFLALSAPSRSAASGAPHPGHPGREPTAPAG